MGSLLHCSESRTVKHVGTPSFSAILLTSILLSTLFGGIPFVYVTFQGLVHTGHFDHEYLYCTCAIHALHEK